MTSEQQRLLDKANRSLQAAREKPQHHLSANKETKYA